MIEFGLCAPTLENSQGTFGDRESRLLKNTNGMIIILIILVCAQTTVWRDVHLYRQSLGEVPRVLRPSDHTSSPASSEAVCARDPAPTPAPVARIFTVPISPGSFPSVCKSSTNPVIPPSESVSHLSATFASPHGRARTPNSPPSFIPLELDFGPSLATRSGLVKVTGYLGIDEPNCQLSVTLSVFGIAAHYPQTPSLLSAPGTPLFLGPHFSWFPPPPQLLLLCLLGGLVFLVPPLVNCVLSPGLCPWFSPPYPPSVPWGPHQTCGLSMPLIC